MQMSERMKALAKKHPKSISELVKIIRARKQTHSAVIAEAIETLDIHQSANFTLLNGIIDEKIRKSNNFCLNCCALTSLATATGVLLAVHYG